MVMDLKKKVKRLEDALKAIRDFEAPEDLPKYVDLEAYCNKERTILAHVALATESELVRLMSP